MDIQQLNKCECANWKEFIFPCHFSQAQPFWIQWCVFFSPSFPSPLIVQLIFSLQIFPRNNPSCVTDAIFLHLLPFIFLLSFFHSFCLFAPINVFQHSIPNKSKLSFQPHLLALGKFGEAFVKLTHDTQEGGKGGGGKGGEVLVSRKSEGLSGCCSMLDWKLDWFRVCIRS